MLFLSVAGAASETFRNKFPGMAGRDSRHTVTMTASPHILLVEDDHEISRLVSRYLRSNDCHVSVSGDGRNMERLIDDSRVDLVVLDLMLPGEDGLTLCRRLRTRSQVPVIMLTARGEEIDRIVGLEMGADDYMAKPFNPRELLARIRAVLRRAQSAAMRAAPRARALTFLGWRVDCALRELRDPNGVLIAVTGAEFDLLQALCERAGRILSREQLLDLTQGRVAGSHERSIDVLISRLRRKIERDAHSPEIIKTVRSGGYLFTATVEPA
jgi:two-component system OmpR family response regulator